MTGSQVAPSCRERFSLRSRSTGAAVLASAIGLLAAGAVLGAPAVQSGSPAADVALERAQVAAEANRVLGLYESRVATFDLRPRASLPSIDVPIGDRTHRVDLRPHTVRSPRYDVLVYGANDETIPYEAGAPQTVRGEVQGLDGAALAGSVRDDGLHAVILLDDGQRLWIEPVPAQIAAARPGDHLVYRDEDRPDAAAACGAAVPFADRAASAIRSRAAQTGTEVNDLRFTELALDADVEYFLLFGDVDDVVAHMENIVNVVNIQYERDVRISHLITHLMVRTAEPDPYSAFGPSNLLDQFRDQWFRFHSSLQRDVAHFFTGRTLSNNVAGIAYFTGICSDTEGYSLGSRPACGNFACQTDLTAHELGHNWGAPHCSCSGYTMNAVIQGGNQFHPTFTIPLIIDYRDARTCLEIGDDLEGLTIVAPSDTVAESNELPLTALAQFRLHTDRDVTFDAVWSVEPPELGTIDSEGVFSAAEVDGAAEGSITASYAFDGVLAEDVMPMTVVDALAAPASDSSIPETNRYLSFALPAGAGDVAIRVEMVTVFRPDPPYWPEIPVGDFSSFDGEIRWVGPPSICNERNGSPGQFVCAHLSCDPYYTDAWGGDVIHVTAGDIMPSSEYQVRTVPVDCQGLEDACGATSAALTVRTQRWGDIVPPFQVPGGPPGSATQPNVLDIGAIVDKLKGIATAIPQPQAQLHSSFPDPDGGISVLEVSDVVDAVKGLAPLSIGPCVCPTFANCPMIDPCGRCNP